MIKQKSEWEKNMLASQDSTLIASEDSTLIAPQDSPSEDSILIAPQDSQSQDSALLAFQEYEMKLSVYDKQIKDLYEEVKMYSGKPEMKEYYNRWTDIIKQKKEWLQKNPPPC
jgi:hypothetical protein